MAEPHESVLHISSAVVLARPERARKVVEAINCFPDVEVFHEEAGKIVIVLEGPSSRAVGDRLAAIALLDGVIAANLVFEQVDTAECLGEPS